MAKRSAPAVTVFDDGMLSYRVADGVTHLNGQKVTDQTVRLTRDQALYDLAIGRLMPLADPSPAADEV